MKKTFTILIALSSILVTFAQSKDIILQEYFDSTSLPSDWYIAENGTENWIISRTNYAGGENNEAALTWHPDFSGVSRLVTSPVDLTGINTVTVSFLHCLNYFTGTVTLGIATSSDNGQTWNRGWRKSYTSSHSSSAIQQDIETEDMGNPSVRFCIYFTGNSYDIDSWYFDNLTIVSIIDNDISLNGISINNITPLGNTNIPIEISNLGTDTVSTIVASYQLDDEETVTNTFTNFNLYPYDNTRLTFPQSIYLSPGDHDITVNIISANGEADDDPTNNTFSKSISVTEGSMERFPMIEHFSSSTCKPCVAVNQAMVTFTNNNAGKFAYTKYAMDWPNPGDPYYTNEGGDRRVYYICNSVPQLYLDCNYQGNAPVSQYNFDNCRNILAFTELRGAFYFTGNVINVSIDISSYVNLNNVRLIVAVNEKTTTGNIGDNGETEFHHVMMKMLPNANGTTISIQKGETQSYTMTADLSNTHIEDFDDIEVAAFIQNRDTKEIYNSHFLLEYSDHPFPPSDISLESIGNHQIVASWSSPEGNNHSGYNVFVDNELYLSNYQENTITFNTVDGQHTVGVVALYNDNETSVTTYKTITVKDGISNINENTNEMSIFPNPVLSDIFINCQGIKTISIFNSIGQLIEVRNVECDNTSFDVSNYNPGIYIVKVLTNSGLQSAKFVKMQQ